MKMASLLARTHGHARLLRGYGTLPHQSLGSLGRRGARASIDSKGFTTNDFRESETKTLGGAVQTSGAHVPGRGVHGLADQRIRYIEKLAKRDAFNAMLRVPFDHYRLVYDTHPALQGVRCLLLEEHAGVETVPAKKQRAFVATRYDDRVTRLLEIKIMEEFLATGRPDLVVAVYDHRKFMETTVGTVVDEKSGFVTDFSIHFKNFSQLAMRAFDELGDHPRVVSVFDDTVKTGKAPSVRMIRWYLDALLAMRCDDEVRALYADVKDREWQVDGIFYRQMLNFARLKRDSELVAELRGAMAAKKISPHTDHYLHAMQSLQDRVFGVDVVVPRDYRDCIKRIETRAVSPEAYDASERILSLFDEMIDVAKLEPRHTTFFVFSIRAAFLVEEYDRIPTFVNQFEHTFGKPITHGESLLLAVFALLLRDEPVLAWELVIKACEVASDDEEEQARVADKKSALLTSILQYLGTRQDLVLTHQFLDALKAKALLSQFDRDQHYSLIQAVVLDTTHVSDAAILDMLDQYADAFHVGDKESSLKTFAISCMASGRWTLLGQVLKSRNLERMPRIAGWLAFRISEAALKDKSSRERMELVTEIARVADLASLSDTGSIILSENAAQAAKALRALSD